MPPVTTVPPRSRIVTAEPAASSEDREARWTRWVMQTARKWEDVTDVVRVIGLDRIDGDHRKLAEIALEIGDIAELGRERLYSMDNIDRQRGVLERLLAYSEHHFRQEEAIIARYGLPGLDRHHRLHEDFLDFLRAALDDFRGGRLTVAVTLKAGILDWLVEHINVVDYNTFLGNNWTHAAVSHARSWETLREILRPTRVGAIDAEHREMTDLALGLIAKAEAEGGVSVDDFSALSSCAERHFRHEEALIARTHLPGLALQQEQHARFLSHLWEVSLEAEMNSVGGVEKAVQFVLSWWVSHINNVDRISFGYDAIVQSVFLPAQSWEDIDGFILRTGIPEIDRDHREISALLVNLDQVLSERSNLSEDSARFWLDVLEQVSLMASDHFDHEESLMAASSSPLKRVHAEDHQKFRDLIGNLVLNIRSRRRAVSRTIKRDILRWWVRHINEFDVPTFGSVV